MAGWLDKVDEDTPRFLLPSLACTNSCTCPERSKISRVKVDEERFLTRKTGKAKTGKTTAYVLS